MFVLIDIPRLGNWQPPDMVGLILILVCSVLLIDKATRFTRPAAIAAAMLFLEIVRIFRLAGTDAVSSLLDLVYLFLTALLVITLADGVAQFSAGQGHPQIPSLCDTTGHVYALAFVASVAGWWFPSLSNILWLAGLLISLFVIVMFVYFYSAVTTVYEPKAAVGEGEAASSAVVSAGFIPDEEAT
jgi:hypothetical protein